MHTHTCTHTHTQQQNRACCFHSRISPMLLCISSHHSTRRDEHGTHSYASPPPPPLAPRPRPPTPPLLQMGCDGRATGRKRCRYPQGVAAHVGAPSSHGTHLTTCGIASIQPDQPALSYQVISGPHTAEGHREWMWELIERGLLRRWDVTVSDNWSGMSLLFSFTFNVLFA